ARSTYHPLTFISGTSHGTALIWKWKYGGWSFHKISCNDPGYKFQVTQVGWNVNETFAFTLLTSKETSLVKLWNPLNGECSGIIQGSYSMTLNIQIHPFDPTLIFCLEKSSNISQWKIEKPTEEPEKVKVIRLCEPDLKIMTW